MLGDAVACGAAASIRKVARFRLVRMRRFLMADFWRGVCLA